MKFKLYALKLTVLCIAVFALQLIFANFTDLFLLDIRALYEPWRFVTSIFLHGGITHLIYNMFALALFGSLLEGYIGGKRFLLVFFSTGIIANIISVFFYPSSLGASGAIMGIIGALVFLSPMMIVWAFGLPMPMFVAGIIWMGGDLIGLFDSSSNVGHIAHISGMIAGLLLGFLFRRRMIMVKRIKPERVKINEGYMRKWEDYYLK